MSMGEEDARLIASGIVQAFKFIASGEVGALPVRILRDPNEPMTVDPDGRVRYVEQVYRDDFQHRIERDEARAALAASKAECDTMARECAELSENLAKADIERGSHLAIIRQLANALDDVTAVAKVTAYKDLIDRAEKMLPKWGEPV